VFDEVALAPTTDGLGESMRENHTDVDVPCQVEEKDYFERLQMMVMGNAPETVIHLTFHLSDLKRLSLWYEDSDWGGRPKLNVGDRIIGFKDRYNQQLFKTPENPGLFIVEVMPTGFLTTHNLIVCRVSDRAKGVRSVERVS
jgi:hypothetical protein